MLLTPYNGIHLCAGCEAFRCCIHRARYLDSRFYIESFANSICICMKTALLLKFRFCSVLFSLTVATSSSTECLCVCYHHHYNPNSSPHHPRRPRPLLQLHRRDSWKDLLHLWLQHYHQNNHHYHHQNHHDNHHHYHY